MANKLPRLQRLAPIVDGEGHPTQLYQRWWQMLAEAVEARVSKDQTTAWATPTGTFDRTTFTAYAGQTISATPTQAQVQAIDNHVKLMSQHLAALISDLRANDTLT
jgi:hypothetical protein